jgi:hypothetical protein
MFWSYQRVQAVTLVHSNNFSTMSEGTFSPSPSNRMYPHLLSFGDEFFFSSASNASAVSWLASLSIKQHHVSLPCSFLVKLLIGKLRATPSIHFSCVNVFLGHGVSGPRQHTNFVPLNQADFWSSNDVACTVAIPSSPTDSAFMEYPGSTAFCCGWQDAKTRRSTPRSLALCPHGGIPSKSRVLAQSNTHCPE